MFQPFESHAHQWIKRQEKAVQDYCQKAFAGTPAAQSNLDRFIRSAACAKSPMALPSFAQESYQRACSENLFEGEDDQEGAASYDLDPNLVQSVQVPLGRSKLVPLPPAYLNSDSTFERQDPQSVHVKFEMITETFVGIGGHLFQLREVIDYWLPDESQPALDLARLRWWPSQLAEQARLRTIHEMKAIQSHFTDKLQAMNNVITELREGAFGGRLNTKSVVCAQQMFDRLRDLRRMVLALYRSATARCKAMSAMSIWLSEKCLVPLATVKEPYQAERYDRNDPSQAHLGELFGQHCSGILATIKVLSEAFETVSKMFETVECICKTMVEGLHKLMLDVHLGQTTGEFVAGWANRWERVSFALLIRVLGLPAISSGLQSNFPTTEVEFMELSD